MIRSIFVVRAAAHCVAAFLMTAAGLSNAADLDAGRKKAEVCVACHGPAGNSINPVWPSLSAQPAQFITTQLYFFREGNRKDPLMSPHAEKLSNADMNDLAAYFAAQKFPAPKALSPEKTEAGRQLSAQLNCSVCHGAALMGVQHIPRLAGQQADYLRAQLKGFKAQTRFDMDGNMTSAARGLTDEQIEQLAEYLSSLNGP